MMTDDDDDDDDVKKKKRGCFFFFFPPLFCVVLGAEGAVDFTCLQMPNLPIPLWK